MMTNSEFRFFNYEEFDCEGVPGSGYRYMDREFLSMLDEARRLSGLKFKILSGYRNKITNEKLGGVSTNSHRIGRACHIFCQDKTKRYKIVSCLLEAGFVRIGLSSKYIHCDNDAQKPPCIWLIN